MKTSPETEDRAIEHVEAFAKLLTVMAPGRLNELVGGLETKLVGKDSGDTAELVRQAGITTDLLRAAISVRQNIGRLNDLIHASAIALCLETLLEPNERITIAPSLAAGNDASTQRFDLETDRRAAEFKLSVWTSNDSARKRGLFRDLVNLAVHAGDKPVAQLCVVGSRPKVWLNGTKSTVRWAMNGASAKTLQAFRQLDAPLEMPIPEFIHKHAARVEVVDLTTLIPELESMLASTSSPMA